MEPTGFVKWGSPSSHPLTAELLKGRIDSIQTLQEDDFGRGELPIPGLTPVMPPGIWFFWTGNEDGW